MLECQAAKDLSCLVAGYCKLLVDPTLTVFPWTEQAKEHRISAEEGEELGGNCRMGSASGGERTSSSTAGW